MFIETTTRAFAVLIVCTMLAACGGDDDDGGAFPTPTPTLTLAAPPPWEQTEERDPCFDFNPLRTPYFGDLHVHTLYSADAYIFGTRGYPRDVYDFARGETIPISDENEEQTRSAQIDRPLDFAAVTDHAEFFGEVGLCNTSDSAVFEDELCQLLRQAEAPEDRFQVTVDWLFPAGIPDPPASHAFCFDPGVDCDGAAVSVWQEMQDAAEEAYDRSSSCEFTTFAGYEHTASLLGRHRHRNVIFRNHHVPLFAASQLETAREGFPQGLWSAVEDDCLHAGDGCDAVIIPHNSNLSGGEQWPDPEGAEDARRRRDLEPLVEIYQQKGNSECRLDRQAGVGLGTEDELCTFEQLLAPHEFPGTPPPPIDEYPRRNMVRNTLKDGLFFEETLGVNPFKLGFIGSTDTHNATGGNTDEAGWEGAQGNGDASPARQSRRIRNNPGGLAVVWAEENSRDAIFAALRRRETYATSGTRPIVRFFAGRLAGIDCDAADFVERAYETGTPMGGDLGPTGGDASPRFAVFAMKDPGTPDAPGTDLQRVQIVKAWIDDDDGTREKVFEVAGNPSNGAVVDPETCAPVGKGASRLCAVWEDPEFDRSRRALYYTRVLENPTCRWSTWMCKSVGVDPFSADCAEQAELAGGAFANCCLTEESDPFFEPVIQERAWTSPIWYGPENIAGIEGAVTFGTEPGTDSLELAIRIGKSPVGFPEQADLTLGVTDDDEIYRVTISAGTLEPRGPGSFGFEDGGASTDGLGSARYEIQPNGEGLLHLQTGELDLASADRADHMVRVSLVIGAYEASHVRLWQAVEDRLFVSD